MIDVKFVDHQTPHVTPFTIAFLPLAYAAPSRWLRRRLDALRDKALLSAILFRGMSVFDVAWPWSNEDSTG